MKEELKLMEYNEVWDLVILPEVVKQSGVNGSLRPSATLMTVLNGTRPDLLPNVSLRKMVLIKTRPFRLFPPKNSFRIIMAMVAHYDLELHQMNVKTTFLNGKLEVYMEQPDGFPIEGKEHIVCKLKNQNTD